ncbi:hypothetical protein JCM1393_08530 [Clostridium carnis]
MECFYEQFQTKNYGKIQSILNSVAIGVLIIAGLNAVLFRLIMAVIFLVIYGIIIIVCRNVFVEFEYELTNDELVIVKILDMKKRKTVATVDVKSITDVRDGRSKRKENTKVVKACLDGINLKQQVIYTKTSSGLVGFQLAMDEKLMMMMRRINPLAFSNI